MVLPPHAHAVLQLGKFVVEFRCGDLPLGGQVPFVAGVDDAAAVLGAALHAELFQNVQRGSGAFLIIRRKLVQFVAVVSDAGGHSGDTAHLGAQRQQVGQCAAQLVAIVDAAAENQLTIQLDAAGSQLGQVF